MRYRVVVTPRSFGEVSSEPVALLQDRGYDLVFNTYRRPLTEEELKEMVRQADALLVGLDPVTAGVIEAAPRLKVISKYGVGTDNIDLECASRRGIIVTSTPDANTEAVADLTFGLMLCAARQIIAADRSVRAGEWQRFIGYEVWGKTIGVVGTGRIGKAVARRAQGFGMSILLYDIHPDAQFATLVGGEYVALEELLSRADFISVNVALNAGTRHLIGARELSLVRPWAIIVNTARGGVVDEGALLEALKARRLGGAALDVYASEPPAASSELFRLDNVVLTPHIGSYTREAITRMGVMASLNLIQALEGCLPGDPP